MKKRNLILTHSGAERDRGAVLLWFSVMAVAMLGMGALVVDTGALYSERRQLQNGADAAALAVATECAFRTCSTTDAQSVAQTYANLNSQDGASAIAELCGRASGLTLCATPPLGVGSAEYVHVRTQTLSGSGGNEVKYLFAPVLDAANVGGTVNAQATVAWGALSAEFVLPLAASKCFIDALWLVDGKWNFPSSASKFEVRTGPTWSGPTCLDELERPVPQAFDFLNVVGCSSVELDLSGGFQEEPPNNGTNPNCADVLEEYVFGLTPEDRTLYVPVYKYRYPGGTGNYVIDGVIALELCGYRLGGAGYVQDLCPSPSDCTGEPSSRYFCGVFKNVDLTTGVIGGGTDYGTRVIKMIG